mmetsp:Transcript_34967/g.99469  ORF Transcript_34967/g.99469 Transcript_34967/m.99469 type:complete len:214 (-) Transcript_34967:148-789(-)
MVDQNEEEGMHHGGCGRRCQAALDELLLSYCRGLECPSRCRRGGVGGGRARPHQGLPRLGRPIQRRVSRSEGQGCEFGIGQEPRGRRRVVRIGRQGVGRPRLHSAAHNGNMVVEPACARVRVRLLGHVSVPPRRPLCLTRRRCEIPLRHGRREAHRRAERGSPGAARAVGGDDGGVGRLREDREPGYADLGRLAAHALPAIALVRGGVRPAAP